MDLDLLAFPIDLARITVYAPDRIFISVDLPAPFSPSSACTSPLRTSMWTLCRARTPGKCFADPLQPEQNLILRPRLGAGGRCLYRFALGQESVSSPASFLEEILLFGAHLFPVLPRFLHGGHLAHLGHRHVPPALVAGHALIAVILDVDHGRAVGCVGGFQGGDKIIVGLAAMTSAPRLRALAAKSIVQGLHRFAGRIADQDAILCGG